MTERGRRSAHTGLWVRAASPVEPVNARERRTVRIWFAMAERGRERNLVNANQISTVSERQVERRRRSSLAPIRRCHQRRSDPAARPSPVRPTGAFPDSAPLKALRRGCRGDDWGRRGVFIAVSAGDRANPALNPPVSSLRRARRGRSRSSDGFARYRRQRALLFPRPGAIRTGALRRPASCAVPVWLRRSRRAALFPQALYGLRERLRPAGAGPAGPPLAVGLSAVGFSRTPPDGRRHPAHSCRSARPGRTHPRARHRIGDGRS